MIFPPESPPCPGFGMRIAANHDLAQLTLAGEIDLMHAPEIEQCARYFLDEPQVTQVIADLAAVTFMDSSGLRALAHSRRHAQELGKVFRIQNHHGIVAQVIELTGLTKLLTDPDYAP